MPRLIHTRNGLAPMQQDGFALVTILMCVVLIALIAVAVFSSIRTETTSSNVHAESQRARSLAPSALNIVLAQIRAATMESNTVWTSQPGALKTFTGTRHLSNVYKLYSSGLMTESGATYSPANDVPSDWQNRSEDYVDLNAPLAGSNEYPILDPSVVGAVDGFSLKSGTTVQMPVRWLYILKDGSVTTFDKASAANPAVARMAFWTDDETCKLNLNTASEGTFWSPPSIPASSGSGNAMQAVTSMRELSQRQPLQWEYQRYPGHPATTSLSPALWQVLGFTDSYASASGADRGSFRELLYSLLPATQGGGSKGGTLSLPNISSPLALKADRHFTVPDEFFYNSGRQVVVGNSSQIDPSRLKKLRFFLTSSSRSPEINLFKKPKVSMWPIHASSGDSYRTPFDKLSAFAATVGGYPFYFTRSDPYSRTVDLPFATNNRHRNVQLYNYLKQAAETTIPGYGATFRSKYPQDYQQILTEMFDYIRCINLSDRSTTPPIGNPFTPRISLNASGAMTSRGAQTLGAGQVVPIQGPGNTAGFGRFATIGRLGFVIFSELKNASDPSQGTQLRMLLLTQPVNIQHGFSMINSDYRVVLKTTNPITFRWGNQSVQNTLVFEPAGSSLVNYIQATDFSDGSAAIGGPEGYMLTLKTVNIGNKVASKAISPINYPFYSEAVDIPSTVTSLSFEGGGLELEIQAKQNASISSTSTNQSDFVTVQTLKFDFPPFGPVNIPQPGVFGPANSPANLQSRISSFGSLRKNNAWDQQAGIWDAISGDILRNLELNIGDYRISAALSLLPSSGAIMFSPSLGYTTANAIAANIRGNSWGNTGNDVAPGSYGTLVAGMPTSGVAFAPSTMTDALNSDGAPGDFDAAVGGLAVGGQYCGPFINKPDDGSSWSGSNNTFPYMQGSDQMPPNTTFSSPSRQVSSPVIFGSLPTGVFAGRPWQTLLFCPNPASRFGGVSLAHAGEATPPDHLLLEQFDMPVVEPYAISDPFSTAGKVNMNYKILPFTNIERSTALQGVFRSTKLTAVPAPISYQDTRRDPLYEINADDTLQGNWTSSNGALKSFNGVFQSAQTAFIHPSEICEVPLVPKMRTDGWSASAWNGNFDNFWATNRFTADNLREQPYAHIYPRLTTRSNTFTVHVLLQTLSPAFMKLSQQGTAEKAVTATFRANYLVERYLETGLIDFDFAASGETRTMDDFCKVRVLAVDSL